MCDLARPHPSVWCSSSSAVWVVAMPIAAATDSSLDWVRRIDSTWACTTACSRAFSRASPPAQLVRKAGPSGTRRWFPTTQQVLRSVAQRVDQFGAPVAGGEDEVDHAEGVAVGSELRPPAGVAQDRDSAALDGAVELLDHDPGTDPGELATSELGLDEHRTT